MKEKLMTFRIPIEIDIEIEKIASQQDTDKSKLIRELLVSGIKEKQLQEAIKQYAEGRATLWKAATISKVPLWKMIEIIKERKVSAQYSERELKEDIKALRE